MEGDERPEGSTEAFFSACGFPATALKQRHILPEWGCYRGIVLNAPLSSVIQPSTVRCRI
jgi:hypothetical protein